MKKLQFLFAAMMLLASVDVKADDTINSSLNLNNPDVRKCLLEATKTEGWKVSSVYTDAENKIVYVFKKDNETKIYKSK
ncbi:hypothetical protein [Algibacter luteus]|uniref:hypothetical protein n=1 Tax=Algibacter luteus TaxID=1178825 RepID=UPI002594DD1A|nr:hypothetical protein [Algibacter luteus]WJJ97183.1 hypothetical protein O5O44_02130 [Algibacter luteus]